MAEHVVCTIVEISQATSRVLTFVIRTVRKNILELTWILSKTIDVSQGFPIQNLENGMCVTLFFDIIGENKGLYFPLL